MPELAIIEQELQVRSSTISGILAATPSIPSKAMLASRASSRRATRRPPSELNSSHSPLLRRPYRPTDGS